MQNENKRQNYTGADALNDALINAGTDCVFFNSGTDYPPIIESWAKAEEQGRDTPRVIICPHEIPALGAAQGYAQITGKAQAVFVHVDVGTQNLGGILHNAFRCRVPVFIFSGLSPFSIEGELRGGRNAYIQFVQDVKDQGGIVRQYTKMNYEYRSAKNIQQLTYRALQIAHSEPMGPVYMMATREVLEDEAINISADVSRWGAVSPSGLDGESIKILTRALAEAKKPLIITSYSGRNVRCPAELEKLAESYAIPVVEMNHSRMNFPNGNPLHVGFDTHGFIEYADVALIIDCDVPWIPSVTGPKPNCRVFYLDTDPLKEDMSVWYIRAERYMRADSLTAIRQLNEETEKITEFLNKKMIETRRARIHDIHKRQREEWAAAGDEKDFITPEFLTKCVNEIANDDTVVLSENITNRTVSDQLMPRNVPGTYFTNGGGGLGWNGGAAVGMKLACPDKDVIALTGDGTYIFTCPTAVFWMAAKYKTPFLTVIYNNQGWNAPKKFTAGQHPDGYAVRSGKFYSSLALDPPARLDLIAQAAGGAFAKTVSDPGELRQALAEGMEAVRGGTAAVINVMLPQI